MATGTNTVILFMRKRNKYFADNLIKQVEELYKNLVDVSLNKIENIFSQYVNYVWE
jgi:type I restriction enzyme M protein